MRWSFLEAVRSYTRITCDSSCDSDHTESTTIALLARLAGLLEPMRQFLKKKPIWGTCAGAILLAQAIEGAKKGGQELLNGMSITVARNGWGSQVRAPDHLNAFTKAHIMARSSRSKPH